MPSRLSKLKLIRRQIQQANKTMEEIGVVMKLTRETLESTEPVLRSGAVVAGFIYEGGRRLCWWANGGEQRGP
jgi:hypothetical protein